MIKFKNLDEVWADLGVPGSLTVATDKQSFVIPFNCTLKALFAKVGTAGITGSGIIDIKKNGASIFNGATKLTFATTVQGATYDVLAAGAQNFVKGDIVTIDVTQASTTPAKNLGLLMVFARKYVGALQTGTAGLDAE